MERVNLNNIDIALKSISDFITQGAIYYIGEHVYLHLKNNMTLKSFTFYIPKTLFEMMLEKKVEVNDKVEWHEEKDDENKEKVSTQKWAGMFG